MKNTIKVFGIIALVAVIGFSMAACSGDDLDNGGGNGGGDGPSFLGTTPTLSGQVYVQKFDENKGTVSFQAYTGSNQTVYAGNGWGDKTIGQGTIKGGQFSITLGTPTSLDNIKSIFYGGGGSGDGGRVSLDDSDAADLTVSPSTAKGVHLYLTVGSGDLGRANITGVYPNGIIEHVEYFYVDKDCTISSTGKTENPYEGYTDIYITKPFSLALQAGWNTVYLKAQTSVSGGVYTTTSTYSMGNPSNLKWVLYEEG